MKKDIALILSAVMLFTAIPMHATAASDPCDHPVVTKSPLALETVYGYSHPYTTKDGKPAGCTITVAKEYYTETCNECGFIRKVYTGRTAEIHSKPKHD